MSNWFEEDVAARSDEQIPDAQREEAKQNWFAADVASQEEPEISWDEPEEEWDFSMGDARETVKKFGDTFIGGFGDEVGHGIAAAAATFIPNEYEDKYGTKVYDSKLEEWASKYKDIRDSEKIKADEFEEDHGGIGLTAEIGGAVLSPLNKVMPGKTMTQKIVRSGADGALFGSGVADDGEKLEGAGVGAVGGAAGGALFAGAGKMIQKASARRVAQELEQPDGSFIPISLAAETSGEGTEDAIGSFYRDIVGTGWGGHGKIVAQEDTWIGPVIRANAKAKELFEKTTRNAKTRVKEVEAAARKALQKDLDRVKERYNFKKDMSKSELDELAADTLATKSDSLMNAKDSVMKANKELESGFRANAVMNSAPADLTEDEVMRLVNAKNPNEALAILDNFWSTKGFDMLDNRKFQLSPKGIMAQLTKDIMDDPTMALGAVNKADVQKQLTTMGQFLEAKTAKGWIDGNDLAAIRAQLGSLAGSKGDDGLSLVQRRIYTEMQDAINDKVLSQLKGRARERFVANRGKWKTNLVLRDSIASASKKAGREGRFSPDEWNASVARNSVRDARLGRGPLQKEANEAAKLSAQGEEAVMAAQLQITKAADKAKLAGIKAHKAKLAETRRTLAREMREIRRLSEANTTKSRRVAEHRNRIAELDDKMKHLDGLEQSLKDNMTQRNPKIFQRMFASGLMGGGYHPTNMVTGGLIGKGLASPAAQKAIAGQTAIQKRVASGVYDAAGNKAVGAASSVGGLLGQYADEDFQDNSF